MESFYEYKWDTYTHSEWFTLSVDNDLNLYYRIVEVEEPLGATDSGYVQISLYEAFELLLKYEVEQEEISQVYSYFT